MGNTVLHIDMQIYIRCKSRAKTHIFSLFQFRFIQIKVIFSKKNPKNDHFLEKMTFKCRFCGARFEYESNIRSHADMYHAEIVEQIMYRQYVEYLESQQA